MRIARQIIGYLRLRVLFLRTVARFIARGGVTRLPVTDLRAGRRMLMNLLDGYRSTALLYAAAKLGIADLLASGSKTSADLARSLGAHAPSLHRVLRGLVTLGVCYEEHDGRFGLTPLGTWLRADTPGSLRGQAILCGEEWFPAWGGLVHSAMTGETAFNHVFGMSQWEHRKQHPELNEYFNTWLNRGTAGATGAILSAYEFSPFHSIADIGGGQGALLAAILRAHPTANGILFDQPHVVASAEPHLEKAGVARRCQVVGGNFFEYVPEGADVHILKSVLHDWDDEQVVAILRNCHRALREQGTLLVVDRLIPIRANHDPQAILVDLQMLAVTGGRQRREAEYRALFMETGFRLTRVIRTLWGFSIIEAVRAQG